MAVVLARITLLIGLLLPVLTSAAEIYRYLNEKNLPVLDRLGVPPQFIGKGYQILNEQGRVIKVVPPAPTEAERKKLAEDQARAITDAQLVQVYSSQEDVDRALERKLVEVDGLIAIATGNKQSIRTHQDSLQSKAAQLERSGREVPASLVVQIESLQLEQDQLDRQILHFSTLRAETQASFVAERLRLGELLNGRQ